jgi:ABC-2 type transport system permease protein
MSFLRKFIEMGKMEYKTSLAYRLQFMSSIIISPLMLIMSFFIWQAVYSNTGSSIFGYSFNEMIAYYILALVIGHFTYTDVGDELQEKIIYGDLNHDLLKPMSIFWQMLSKQVASRSFAFLVEVVPVFTISFLIFKIGLPSFLVILLFFIGMISSFMINFLLGYLTGLLSFWVKKVESIQWVFFFGIRFLSGEFIPLDFLGSAFISISTYLPFFYMRYGLIQIWLGKYNLLESFKILFIQLIWIAALYLFVRFLWNIAIKKYGAEGG